MGKAKLFGLFVSALAILSHPQSGKAQDLAGWSMIHASSSYDYLVSLESVVRDPSAGDSAPPVRLYLSRMLTRQVDLERSTMVSQRREAGLSSEGYQRYASTTEVVELRCAERQLRLGSSTDFDADGRMLAESPGSARWQRVSAYPDSLAMNALLEWACDGR